MSYLPREDDDGTPEQPSGRPSSSSKDTVGRALGLTALGTVVPGAGLSFTRRRALGLVLFGLFVLGLILTIVRVIRHGLTDSALFLAVRPGLLMLLIVGIVVAALVWIASIIYTAHLTRPSGSSMQQRRSLSLFTALLCLMVALPSAQAIHYVQIQRDVVHTVFKGGGNKRSGTAAPDRTQPDPWAKVPRVNVLLLGSDQGPDRAGTGVRTDSMILASINTRTGNAVLFGVPRNLENVPFPKGNPLHKIYPHGYNCGSECLMDAVWNEARKHKDKFTDDPNPGLTTTQDVLSKILGLPIDDTVIMDLNGFTQLVDAMGGVDVDVKERLPIGGEVVQGVGIKPGSIKGWIEPGQQHLDGRQALWYSRSRATTDDYSRMRRQRCMVGALLTQVNPISLLKKYPSLAKVAKKNIQTDIDSKDLPAWVKLVETIQDGEIHSLTFTAKNTNVGRPNFAKIRKMVQKAIKNADRPTPTAPAKPHPRKTSTPKQGNSPTRSQDKDDLVNVKDAC